MTKSKLKPFQPAFGLSNNHLQTIYSSIFRKQQNIHYDIKKFFLSDGDFVECYWHKSSKQTTNTPLCVIFHGLAGSYESPYIEGVVQELDDNGFDAVVMHFRGCAIEENLLPRSYHSGETGDALEFLRHLKKRRPEKKLYTVGYSLGANMMLKLLGELKENSLIEKAVGISPPMQLKSSADSINKGFSRYYQHRLMQLLNSSLEKKFVKHNMNELIQIKKEEIKNLKTFWEFDDAYTAPVHGFVSAEDYYDKCSSKQYLKFIQTPTLIIHSKDDPFMSQAVIPSKEELSATTTLELYNRGGHVGFIAGSFLKPVYWLEKRVVEYLLE